MWKTAAKRSQARKSASTGVGEKTAAFPHRGGKGPGFPPYVVHICTKSGGNVEKTNIRFYSYRALMLEFRSLMTSLISGLVFMSFSTPSMECMTVVWSRPSNYLPISFRERLVICRI